jgi:hypothetical protein
MASSRMMFADARTALNVSFGMSTRTAQVSCSFRDVLVAAMNGARLTNARQRDWYARMTRISNTPTELFGLNAFERHAQCALVRQAVQALPEAQACALIISFSQTQAEQVAGINGLTTHLCGRVSPPCDPVVMRELIVRRYLHERSKDGFSLRAISARVSVSKSHLARIARLVDRECTALEADGLTELQQRFDAREMCDPIITLR